MDTTKMRSLVICDGIEGKICSRCGEWKPLDGFNRKLRFVHSQCKVCQKQMRDALPKPDRHAYYVQYRETHKEKITAYKQQNKERFRIYAHQYQQKNSDKHREENRRWAERNKQQRSLAYRHWRKNNPDKALQNDHRRRARLRNAPGKFTLAEWESLKAIYNNICLRCGRPEGEVKLVADHVIPLAKGGSNFIENIQPLCEICNKRKGVRVMDYRRLSTDD